MKPSIRTPTWNRQLTSGFLLRKDGKLLSHPPKKIKNKKKAADTISVVSHKSYCTRTVGSLLLHEN